MERNRWSAVQDCRGRGSLSGFRGTQRRPICLPASLSPSLPWRAIEREPDVATWLSQTPKSRALL